MHRELLSISINHIQELIRIKCMCSKGASEKKWSVPPSSTECLSSKSVSTKTVSAKHIYKPYTGTD